MIKAVLLLKLFLVSFLLSANTQDNLLSLELLDNLQSLYRSKSSKASLQMTVHRLEENFKRSIEIEAYSFADNYTLIRILSPQKDRGIATLMRDKKIWN